jgi:hypothetical protein
VLREATALPRLSESGSLTLTFCAGLVAASRCELPPLGRRRANERIQEPARVLSLRHPPARLLAMICWSIAVRARALIMSPRWNEIIRAVLFSWPAVMMPSGSGTNPPVV